MIEDDVWKSLGGVEKKKDEEEKTNSLNLVDVLGIVDIAEHSKDLVQTLRVGLPYCGHSSLSQTHAQKEKDGLMLKQKRRQSVKQKKGGTKKNEMMSK